MSADGGHYRSAWLAAPPGGTWTTDRFAWGLRSRGYELTADGITQIRQTCVAEHPGQGWPPHK
jgi:hypothetical protein